MLWDRKVLFLRATGLLFLGVNLMEINSNGCFPGGSQAAKHMVGVKSFIVQYTVYTVYIIYYIYALMTTEYISRWCLQYVFYFHSVPWG